MAIALLAASCAGSDDAVPGVDLPGEDVVTVDVPTDEPEVVADVGAADIPAAEDRGAPEADAEDVAPAPDVPELPPLRTLAKGFHVPLEPPAPGETFSVIMASDPQLWWNFERGRSGLDDDEVEEQNRRHVAMRQAAAP